MVCHKNLSSVNSAGSAKLVFGHCIQEVKIADERGSYYRKVHYNYDYIEDFQCLFWDQGPKIRNNSSGHECEEIKSPERTGN